MPKILILKPSDYEQIESKINLVGDEDYSVIAQRRLNKVYYSIHVFARQPSTKEMVEYEETTSRLKFRGTRAEIEGSQVLASKRLYDVLIVRAYDVLVNRQVIETLDRATAIEKVPILVKREAVRDFIGNVQSASSLAEDEGEETTVSGKEGD